MQRQFDGSVFECESFPVQDVPFEELFFSRKEIEFLKKYSSEKQIKGKPEELKPFIMAGLVEMKMERESPYTEHYFLTVSERGRHYLAFCSARKRHWKRDNWQFWITTLLSAAALIKSYWPEIAAAAAYLLQRSGQ